LVFPDSRNLPTFIFVLKVPAEENGESEKLLITRLPPHRFQCKRSGKGKLTGFTTDNQIVVRNFKDELEGIRRVVIKKYGDKRKLIKFLKSIIKDGSIPAFWKGSITRSR